MGREWNGIAKERERARLGERRRGGGGIREEDLGDWDSNWGIIKWIRTLPD